MSESKTYPVRLPAEQFDRINDRARETGEPMSVVLRRYIDAGDMADSMAENNSA